MQAQPSPPHSVALFPNSKKLALSAMPKETILSERTFFLWTLPGNLTSSSRSLCSGLLSATFSSLHGGAEGTNICRTSCELEENELLCLISVDLSRH